MSVWLPSASYPLAGRTFPDMPVEFLTDDEAAAGKQLLAAGREPGEGRAQRHVPFGEDFLIDHYVSRGCGESASLVSNRSAPRPVTLRKHSRMVVVASQPGRAPGSRR